uniref:S-methyl-5-thioribose kinase n=1 Tax=Herpetomonas muscarum TaxID=5718 RepID=U5KLM8_HERMU|nr:S-methyl-5-thioribose kinase [Herpetomonas muscarum]
MSSPTAVEFVQASPTTFDSAVLADRSGGDSLTGHSDQASLGAASPAVGVKAQAEKAFRSSPAADRGADGDEAYHILTTEDVLEYAERTLPRWLPISSTTGERVRPGELVSAEEVGDGNLNLVFRLLDAGGCSRAVLKQSLPYVRCVGESWPLTLDRNRLEADTLIAHYAHAPAVTEKVLFHSSAMGVMVLEDLSDMVIWRGELVKGRHHGHVLPQLSDYLARVHFFTSDFAQDAEAKKHAVQRVTNVDMCRITEDLFFADPYIVHERNNYEAAQEPFIESFLRQDAALKVRVAQLKHAFMNKAEAHVHGDIHSGSVFIDGTRVKAIDAEFGFYGPMGFDVGTVVGNLLMNYVALPALLAQRGVESDEFPSSRAPTTLTAGEPASQAQLLQSLDHFWAQYAETFLALAGDAALVRDVSFGFPGYAAAFLQENVLPDSIGFAGTEMIRRTIGLAHVADLDGIKDDAARLAAKEQSLRLGAALIKRARAFASFSDLVAFVQAGEY